MRVERLVCALAGATLLVVGSYADTANNSFASVSGDGVVADGESGFCIENVEGSVNVTVGERPGWKCEKGTPFSYDHNEGDVDYFKFYGLDDEESVTIAISNIWVCVHDTTNNVEHGSPPGAVIPDSVHKLGAYFSPKEEGYKLYVSTNKVVAPILGHHTNKVFAVPCPNPKCDYGKKENPIGGNDVEIDPSPVIAYLNSGKLQEDGSLLLDCGEHTIGYTAHYTNDCKDCEFGVSFDYLRIDVCKVESAAEKYIGLDRTDAGYGKDHTITGAVSLTHAPGDVRYLWTVKPHCKIDGKDNEASVLAKVKRIAGEVPGGWDFEYSDSYEQEHLMCEVKLKDDICNPPCESGAGTENDFTIVKVDVTIDDVPETIEEAEGAFTYYVPDGDAPIWAEEWTNSLKDVSITCEPHDGEMSNQIVKLDFPVKHLYVENEDGTYVEAKKSYTVKELNKTKFKLHGHKKSEKYKDKEIVAEHVVSHATDTAKFTVFGRPWLVPDYNRKNGIEKVDYDKSEGGTIPFRFWINDDDDNGADDLEFEGFFPVWHSNGSINKGSNNQPGKGDNNKDEEINGYSDILDFSALLVDVLDVFPAETPDYIKNNTRWYFTSACVNVVYTDLEVDEVQTFHASDHERYGKRLGQHAYEAEVMHIPGELPAPDKFQERLHKRKHGIILIEGNGKGDRLRIRGKTNTGFDICTGHVLLSISPVEEMYRWLDLRGAGKELLGESHQACKCAETLCNGMEEPSNNPDSNCNGDPRDGRHIVFVHGYNINAREATAWGAEMFKRLWQSGSTSLFTVADWVGDAGQFWDPDDGTSVSYYFAVPNAFAAAKPLKEAVCAESFKGNPVIMAHSLGNMLVSSAIVDWEMPYGKYYLLNAAVAIQAYEDRRDYLMNNEDWKSVKEDFWSAYWYRNFKSNDFRSLLFWPGRFGHIDKAVNCFSGSDDIVHNKRDDLFQDGPPFSAWTFQECHKGKIEIRVADRIATAISPDSPKYLGTEAGWGFNISRVGALGFFGQPNTSINDVPFEEIVRDPVFYPFKTEADKMNSPELFECKKGDWAQYILRAKLLGSAIPATSFAAGANAMRLTPSEPYQNYEGEDWPRRDARWHHSDLKNVAYFYNKAFFDFVVENED